eukprot:m.84451 g.84451  ORF g.84451 m.84451 type:complete len:325 (+) comp15022_c0_seq3:36-1010(+)
MAAAPAGVLKVAGGIAECSATVIWRKSIYDKQPEDVEVNDLVPQEQWALVQKQINEELSGGTKCLLCNPYCKWRIGGDSSCLSLLCPPLIGFFVSVCCQCCFRDCLVRRIIDATSRVLEKNPPPPSLASWKAAPRGEGCHKWPMIKMVIASKDTQTTVFSKQPRASASIEAKPTQVFLTHCWGNDTEGRDNHARVTAFNAALQKLGIVTWFDGERMQDHIKAQMADGIDNTKAVLVFVTRRYCEKVASGSDEYCAMEFNYAHTRKGASKLIPIVMEPDMRSTKSWSGPLGLVLSGHLYFDMVDDADVEGCARQVVSRLRQISDD